MQMHRSTHTHKKKAFWKIHEKPDPLASSGESKLELDVDGYMHVIIYSVYRFHEECWENNVFTF